MRETIPAEVREGTKRDAILFSVGANAKNGLPRSGADKERSVLMLLADDEWSEWSNREIARQCRVDHKTVEAVRSRNASLGNSPVRKARTKHGTVTKMDTTNIGSKPPTTPKQPRQDKALPSRDVSIDHTAHTDGPGYELVADHPIPDPRKVADATPTCATEDAWRKMLTLATSSA